MMTKYALFIFITMISLIGCSKDDSQDVDCVASRLETLNMVAYEGQTIECQSFLRLFEYNGAQYFLLDSYCADLNANPTDCGGNELCETGIDNECNEFYENAAEIEIVGITE